MPRSAQAVAVAVAVAAAVGVIAVGGGCVEPVSDEELQQLPTPPFPLSFTTVPLNVKPILFDTARSDEDISFVRRFDDTGRPDAGLSFTKIAQLPFEENAYIVDPGPLAPGEQLFIEALCDGCSLAGSWTIGDVADDEAPDVDPSTGFVVGANGIPYESFDITAYTIAVQLPPLDGAAVYRFIGDGNGIDHMPRIPQEGLEDGTRSFTIVGGDARTECFTPVAVDVAGNETRMAELCADLDPAVNARGCASTGASSTSLVALSVLALLALAQRRRAALILVVAFGGATGAQAAPPPPPLPPTAVVPPTSSTIPTNARIVFSGDDFNGLRFERLDTQAALQFTRVDAGNGFSTLFIVEPGALVAGEELLIEASCPECFQADVATFDIAGRVDETAPDFVFGPATAPQVGSSGTVNCIGIGTTDSYFVNADLPPVTDDSGPMLLRVETPESVTLEAINGDPAQTLGVSFEAAPGPAREVCATVTAIDVAGNETQFAQPICATVGETGGCAQTAPDAFVVVAVALALRVKRRRR